MFEFRHVAMNIDTGEVINCERGSYLKKQVAHTVKFDRKHYGSSGRWRWCHDFGRKWMQNGYPVR